MNEAPPLVDDPRWLPHRLNLHTATVTFIKADRDAHRSVTFLDDQLAAHATEHREVPLASLGQPTVQPGRCHFIFHSAFCRSTLLARALDVPGKAMGLKEPLVLNDLALGASSPGTIGAVHGQLARILPLLARPFADGERVVVKPSNIVNPLIKAILDLTPSSKALLMSSELPAFLLSVAGKGLFGRIWARRLQASLSRTLPLNTGFSESELWEHSDLQVAALGWLHQRAQFATLLSGPLAGRVASLDSELLVNHSPGTIAAVSDFFELGLSSDEVQALVEGPVFETDSKKGGEAYDAERRRADRAALESVVGEEIAMVVKWIESVADFANVPLQLPKPLIVS